MAKAYQAPGLAVRNLQLADIESEWHGDETREALEQAERDRMNATQDSRLYL